MTSTHIERHTDELGLRRFVLLHERGLGIYTRRPDKAWSLTYLSGYGLRFPKAAHL